MGGQDERPSGPFCLRSPWNSGVFPATSVPIPTRLPHRTSCPHGACPRRARMWAARCQGTGKNPLSPGRRWGLEALSGAPDSGKVRCPGGRQKRRAGDAAMQRICGPIAPSLRFGAKCLSQQTLARDTLEKAVQGALKATGCAPAEGSSQNTVLCPRTAPAPGVAGRPGRAVCPLRRGWR